MRRITVVLGAALPAMLLSASIALAQQPTPPAPAAKAPDPANRTSPAPQPSGPQAMPTPAVPGPNAVAAPNGPPEGMVVETPNGFYLIRPGESAPRRLDIGPSTPGAPQPGGGLGMSGGSGPRPAMDEPGMRTSPPPPETKGARFSVKTPNLELTMKCPDDEPIKSCVDAVSQLLDKANTPKN